MKTKDNHPAFYYVTGCDGTGKTTQARLLADYLRRQGLTVTHVWLRFPFFFCSPFLLYAHLSKLSWSEVHEGQRFGYWDFRSSWMMRNIFPWVLLLDAFLATCWKVYFPLALGRIVVCERFVLDMLVDLSLAYKNDQFINTRPGIWLAELIPAHSKVIVLDLESNLIRERRKELAWDHRLEERLTTFRYLAAEKGIPVIINRSPINDICHQILTLFGL